jgi:hypothetical protein
MVVLDPETREPVKDEEGRQLVMTLASDLHDATLRAKRQLTKEVQKATAITGELEPDDEREINRRFIAGRILGWGPMTLEIGGRQLSPTSTADKVTLLTELDWLREAIDNFFVRKTGFLAAKQTDWSPTSSTGSSSSDRPPPAAAP